MSATFDGVVIFMFSSSSVYVLTLSISAEHRVEADLRHHIMAQYHWYERLFVGQSSLADR
jgi:hypothetical protein